MLLSFGSPLLVAVRRFSSLTPSTPNTPNTQTAHLECELNNCKCRRRNDDSKVCALILSKICGRNSGGQPASWTDEQTDGHFCMIRVVSFASEKDANR